MTTDEAMDLEHAMIDPCPNCAAERRKSPGLVFWDGQFPLAIEGWSVFFTGRCDVCRSSAFWCWGCGEKVVVPDAETYECGCERTWFVEKDQNEAVFVLRVEDGEVPLDRRPLR